MSNPWKKHPDGSYSRAGYMIIPSDHGGYEVRWWGTLLDRCSTLGAAKDAVRILLLKGSKV